MSTEGAQYRPPGKKWHAHVVSPTTRPGKWAVGLVAAILVLAVAVVIVPGDSLPAVITASALALAVVAAGVSLYAAIIRRAERALSVYAAAFVLIGGILFVLLHSLFISD